MSYTKPTEIDNTPGGDQVNQAVMKNDQNITAAYQALNELAASITPEYLLDSIKTVDGSGSGLDADLLDGHHSSEFLGVSEKAVDSDKLDGHDSSYFLSTSGKAYDSDKLDGHDSSYFLSTTGTAANSSQLGGNAPSYYLSTTGTAANSNKLGGYTATYFSASTHTHPNATTSSAGFMSSDDKTKLDGLGGDGDMTAQEILDALKTVDGPSSGLDADLLDGHQASYFLQANGTAVDSDKLGGYTPEHYAYAYGDYNKSFYCANPVYDNHAVNKVTGDSRYLMSSSASTTATANSIMKRKSDGSAEVSALYVNDDGNKGIFFYNSDGGELYFQDYNGNNHLIISW